VKGDTGSGVLPDGGTTGQILAKISDDNGDATWTDTPTTLPAPGSANLVLKSWGSDIDQWDWYNPPAPNGGLTNQVLTKFSDDDGQAQWMDPPVPGVWNTHLTAGGVPPQGEVSSSNGGFTTPTWLRFSIFDRNGADNTALLRELPTGSQILGWIEGNPGDRTVFTTTGLTTQTAAYVQVPVAVSRTVGIGATWFSGIFLFTPTTSDASKVNRAGDSMTGPLNMVGAAFTDAPIVWKNASLVEQARIESAFSFLSLVIPDAGTIRAGTASTAKLQITNTDTRLYGTVLLQGGDPTAALGAATKQYVDAHVGTQINVYLTPGTFTWTKPANAVAVLIEVVSGGGGGGSGRRGATSTIRQGGAGGGGGGFTTVQWAAVDLPATLTVIVGAGGAGGAAVGADDTSGNNGVTGGYSTVTDTSFINTYAGAYAAFAGLGGAAGSITTGGQAGVGRVAGGFGGIPSGTGGVGASSAYSVLVSSAFIMSVGGATGGGAGGGVNTSNVHAAGGSGAPPAWSPQGAGGNPGTAGGGAGGAASTFGVASTKSATPGGGGGGGGGQSGAGGGGVGGAGQRGGGGGGGGACLNGNASGAGGKGGDGIVVITTYF
jgi:hypothetical protein